MDDIFLFKTHGEEELLGFHKDFNWENHHIDIITNHSAEEVNFLNTTLILKKTHSLLHYLQNLPINKPIYTPNAICNLY